MFTLKITQLSVYVSARSIPISGKDTFFGSFKMYSIAETADSKSSDFEVTLVTFCLEKNSVFTLPGQKPVTKTPLPSSSKERDFVKLVMAHFVARQTLRWLLDGAQIES